MNIRSVRASSISNHRLRVSLGSLEVESAGPRVSCLRLELGDHIVDLLFLIARRIFVVKFVIGVPVLVVLILTLQCRKVQLKAIEGLGGLLAKVSLHAEVEARL